MYKLQNICYNETMFGKLKSGPNQKSQTDSASTATISRRTSIKPNPEQQNRIIAYFLNNKDISTASSPKLTISDEDRQKFQDRLDAGDITPNEIAAFLRNVAMPLQDTKEALEKIYNQIEPNLRQKQILAVATGHNATDWQHVNENDLKLLLAKPTNDQPDYRTPVGFALFRNKFIDGISDKATIEQILEYEEAMDALEHKIYGKRFDYYQQIELLRLGDQAIAMITELHFNPSANDTGTNPNASSSPTTPLTAEQSLDILSHSIITGDPWHQDGNEYPLTIANLTNNGVMPAAASSIPDQNIFLSQPFQLSNGHGAALGYFPTTDGYIVRGFYLNPNTGFWHFAPDIIRGARGEGMSQVTEGYGPNSTILPLILQKDLNSLIKTQGFQEITTVNPDFLFAGTAPAYNSTSDYREALNKHQIRSDFYKEVDPIPIVVGAQVNNRNKTVPQLISINANYMPDFQKFVDHFTTYSILAGPVQVSGFRSQDDQLIWMFCSDEYGRTWIGSIEVVSPITSTGCHEHWSQPSDITTPLYEYNNQASNYGDPNDVRKGMTGMWNQYLSKIPLIQAYLNWKNQQTQ